jgi:hypothetical protein
MPKWTGRIRGTINDDFEVEADTEEEARESALSDWRYVEFEDLGIDHIEEEKSDE